MGGTRRVTVYIDGFNLYYGALKALPAARWLDLQALGQALAPGCHVRVRYFTAMVRILPGHPDSLGRQRLYLRAVGTTPVTVHYGHFTTHPTTLPLDGRPGFARVLKTEEKGSDVNLATYLLLDGFDKLFDEAIVVTDDSDLADPVEHAAARFGPVHVVSPRAMRLAALTRSAASWRALDPRMLLASQFASPLTLPSGRPIQRPTHWK